MLTPFTARGSPQVGIGPITAHRLWRSLDLEWNHLVRCLRSTTTFGLSKRRRACRPVVTAASVISRLENTHRGDMRLASTAAMGCTLVRSTRRKDICLAIGGLSRSHLVKRLPIHQARVDDAESSSRRRLLSLSQSVIHRRAWPGRRRTPVASGPRPLRRDDRR